MFKGLDVFHLLNLEKLFLKLHHSLLAMLILQLLFLCLLAEQNRFTPVHISLLSHIDAGEHEWLGSTNYSLYYVCLFWHCEHRCLVHLYGLICADMLVVQFLIHKVQLLQLVQSRDVFIMQHFALEICLLKLITYTANLNVLHDLTTFQLCDSSWLG